MKFAIYGSILLTALIVSVVSASAGGGLKITSPVFKDSGAIPKQYTCDGKDVNPPLSEHKTQFCCPNVPLAKHKTQSIKKIKLTYYPIAVNISLLLIFHCFSVINCIHS